MHCLDMQSRSCRCYKSHDFSQGNTEEKGVIFIKDAQGFPFSSFRFKYLLNAERSTLNVI